MAALKIALCLLLCFCSSVSAKTLKVKYVVHEVRSGPNGTIVTSAGALPTWGTLLMNDNVVRATEGFTSKVLGKSTGIGGITTKAGIGGGILSITKVLFTDKSKYNASTITFTGTFAVPNPPYELIVLGGTGCFRGVKGYGLATPGVFVNPIATTKIELYLNWKKF